MLYERNRLRRQISGVSVIIPVLNEAATIGSVVHLALQSAAVHEVIVVDDGSIDGTPEIAQEAGAKVITSTLLGKGASMEDGLREAETEVLAYLDGDLEQLRPDAIDLLVAPILAGDTDFVKARFTRNAGRVTALTAKPLLRTYFPELSELGQPLGGIIAARRSLLQNLSFENDYGVDAGLLIDAFLQGARVAEVNVGTIEHRSKPLENLTEMANQVARTILERAAKAGRLRLSYIRQSREIERIARLTLTDSLGRVPVAEKIALFDMDGVLLNGRFIVSLARAADREDALAALLDNFSITPDARMRQIAAVLAGIRRETFERVARTIPLNPGAVETVVGLRKAGYRVGIVTDSYNSAAEIVRRRVFADFCFSHDMRFRHEKATGRVIPCPAMLHANGCKLHQHCKLNVLLHLIERLEISASEIVAVGDGENDICMLRAAGLSVAYRPKNRAVRAAASHTTLDLTAVLRLALPQHDRTDDLATDI